MFFSNISCICKIGLPSTWAGLTVPEVVAPMHNEVDAGSSSCLELSGVATASALSVGPLGSAG